VSFLHAYTNLDSVSETIGAFTITISSDGSGNCAGIVFDSNGQKAHVTDDGRPPMEGTTLDASNGYSSDLGWTSWFDSGDIDSGPAFIAVFSGATDNDSSQFDDLSLYARDGYPAFNNGGCTSGGYIFGE